jgi:shikimate kinase
MNSIYMYILSGMSFAGKSVLAREISKAKHVEIIDPDEVAHEKGLGLHGEFLSNEDWGNIHLLPEFHCLRTVG